jgi:Tol biopolymer transport system component
VWLVVVVVLAVVAIAAVAALLLLPLGDGGGDESPTPVASTSVTPIPGESQYLAAAVGPRANRLATVAADGTTNELMTFNGRDIYQIAYSPDGKWLACIAGTYKRSDVWLYEAGGVAPERVAVAAPAVLAIDSIAWLSAGELLIAGYTVTPTSTGENAAFVVYDPVTQSVAPLEDSAGVALRGVSVSASRDGTKVAFVTYTDQKSNEYGMPTATERLKLLDRASGAVAELGSGEAFFDVNARRFDDPLLSPAGNALIYRRAGSDVGTSYTVIDANGATLMTEKETEFPAGYAWDPGSTKVVFTGHSLKPADNESGVGPAIFWVFDLEVGGPAQVIARYKDTMVQELSWSPDGASIAWAEYDQEKYRTGLVYLTSAAGGDAALLTKNALSPVWAPDAGAGLQTSPSTSP